MRGGEAWLSAPEPEQQQFAFTAIHFINLGTTEAQRLSYTALSTHTSRLVLQGQKMHLCNNIIFLSKICILNYKIILIKASFVHF